MCISSSILQAKTIQDFDLASMAKDSKAGTKNSKKTAQQTLLQYLLVDKYRGQAPTGEGAPSTEKGIRALGLHDITFYQSGECFARARLVLTLLYVPASVCLCVCWFAIITCAKLHHTVTMPL